MHELAKTANEEVKLQNIMIDVLGVKIDDVHDHVTNVNSKLKTTLEEARKSDKICMVREINLLEMSYADLSSLEYEVNELITLLTISY